MELELSKEFEESVESIGKLFEDLLNSRQFDGKYFIFAKKNFVFFTALHPTGMYVLAGFSDKLRLMNILIDDIKTFREFPFRNSTSCSFSCGGHLLAAVSHNKISIFSR